MMSHNNPSSSSESSDEGEEWEKSSLRGFFVWDDCEHQLTFINKGQNAEQKAKRKPLEEILQETLNVGFVADYDDETVTNFIDIFQRKAAKYSNPIVLLRDVKDVVIYLSNIDIPSDFITFFHTPSVDRLLRALIVYFQYYLLVVDVVAYRHKAVTMKLRHPNADKKERVFEDNLNKLRFIASREFMGIVMGDGEMATYHHTKLGLTRSKGKRDTMLHELLFRFATQVVEVALNERMNFLIEDEMNRMFKSIPFSKEQFVPRFFESLTKPECKVLGSHFKGYKVNSIAAALREVKRPHWDQEFIHVGQPQYTPKTKKWKAWHIVYMCPEEKLASANIKIGLLGHLRSKYDALLNTVKPKGTMETSLISLDRRRKPSITEVLNEKLQMSSWIVTKVNPYAKFCFRDDMMVQAVRPQPIAMWLKHTEVSSRLPFSSASASVSV